VSANLFSKTLELSFSLLFETGRMSYSLSPGTQSKNDPKKKLFLGPVDQAIEGK